MAEQQTIDAVLNAWRGRGPYHDQMRGVIEHRWPRLAQALERLDRGEHVTASAGIAVVAAATADPVARELRHTADDLRASGYVQIEHHPKRQHLRAGARVHHVGESFPRALRGGTADVVSVWRKGTDEKPSSWERSYGRPDIEVIVTRDPRPGVPVVSQWADYHTVVLLDLP